MTFLIALRGVEEVDSRVERRMHCRNRLTLILLTPDRPTGERPTAERHCRYFDIRSAQLSIFHVTSLWFGVVRIVRVDSARDAY